MTRHSAFTSRRDDGAMSVEVVLLTPILVMFLLLVLAGGRYVAARADIESAARDAARAASFERDPASARAAAYAAANEAGGPFTACRVESIDGSLEAGGVVDVTISCEVSNSGLSLIGLSGSRTFTASSSAPIDQYRRFG